MPITLFEPFRAVFYTPFYLPFALGTYADERLDVRLAKPDQHGAAAQDLIDGKADVIWSGPMRLMQFHDRDPNCPLVGFCEVVTRDPFFLIGRRPNADFAFPQLAELHLATVSEVPTPWMCLQEDIRRAGVDPGSLRRTDSRTMAENVAALRAGEVDVIQVFEPFVEELVASGEGHIWYAAADRGPTTYTTLITTKRTILSDPETLHRMARAIYRCQLWLHDRSAGEVAAAVSAYFPDMTDDVLAGAIDRYQRLGIWGGDPRLPVSGFVRLKLGLLSGGFIRRDVPFEACVDNSFAAQVMAEAPSPPDTT